jgi:uncharacterized protein (DUF934 family)
MSEPTLLFAPVKPSETKPRLWRAGGFAVELWTHIDDATPLPADGYAIVMLDRWRRDRVQLLAPAVPLGISLDAHQTLDPASDALAGLQLIALDFPKFSDGRAYSTAHRLRSPWGFTGEIRATGDVLLDQLPLMLRTGFDAFEISDAATLRALDLTAVPAISRVYQAGTQSPGSVSRRRVAP